MHFEPHFLRTSTLLIVSLPLIIAVAALHPTYAAELQAESEAERYVLEQLQKGKEADLEEKFPTDRFPRNHRELSASFIAKLLTSHDAKLKIHRNGVRIKHAHITGDIDLTSQEIPYDVTLSGCTFEGFVDFSKSHFARNLALEDTKFSGGVFFFGAIIDSDFLSKGCSFSKPELPLEGLFEEMRVGQHFMIESSTFDNQSVSFHGVRVGGGFEVVRCTFSDSVLFNGMRVDGFFSAYECTFKGGIVYFVGSHFSDFDLGWSTFDSVPIFFTRMQADVISVEHVNFTGVPFDIDRDQMTFKMLRPVNLEKLQFMLSPYDAEFYTAVESSFRTHGYPDEADEIFIAKKRAERRENCKSVLHECQRAAWALSIFEDALAGYGKSLQNLLYWSLGFLILGMFVFRSEKGMRTKDPKDAENYEGKYHAFWYSLDLFLPIIKLGEADVWTPKNYRRWANLYRKVHIIIGSLFVPIGLAAWTGIIK